MAKKTSFPKTLYVKWADVATGDDPYLETATKADDLAPAVGEAPTPLAEYRLVGTAQIEARPVISRPRKAKG